MLELRNIKKDYAVGDTKVHALKGVDLAFRQSEFVSILGPSGCGKTTLLNIIGGLDHYTSGDLMIDNISTKSYTDRDWDTYRNHRVGFIFQSYNLIPHQTILENVELALNISGVDKKTRTQKAKDALDKVGLKGQYNKKPNQLSGGQCQRVAIARALVNDPEILLADEPTGALDSETSVQIMDLIQDIAKQCLVIMVTHNPELADQYSTRIIRLLDGSVVSDSDPFDVKAEVSQAPKKKNASKKSKLSFWSAFKLSAKNLYSKFKRTFMVCLAGSIGIIGVATVLAVSTGVQGYINNMQNDMLSGNPITVSEEAMNLSALMSASGSAMTNDALKASVENGYVNVDSMVEFLIARSGDMSSFRIDNDITQQYVDFVYDMPSEYYATIVSYYGINLANNVYTDYDFEGTGNTRMSLSTAIQIYTAMLNKTEYSEFAKYITSFTDNFVQAPDDTDFILSQYDIISDPNTSKVATASNEIMIVVDDETAISDLLLAQLGYFSQEEFFNIVYKYTENTKYQDTIWKDKFSYEELLGKTFTWYPNDTVYNTTPVESAEASINPFTYNAYANETWSTGKDLTVTAILRPKKGVSYGCLDSGIYYTSALSREIIADSLTSEIVEYLVASGQDGYNSSSYSDTNIGITYNYSFTFEGTAYNDNVGFVGTVPQLSTLIGSATGTSMPVYYTLTLRELGGCVLPNELAIYPTNFKYKDNVTDYLKMWNSDKDLTIGGVVVTADERTDVEYTDNLAIVINLVNNLIDIVTYALVAFTALSLVVSTVMVAIITYVSVMERVKEIGVIRSLGGRKRDVSSLFIAETFIIGGVSGLIGVGITYGLSGIINLILGRLVGIYTIATLPVTTALIMVGISIGLTLISGLIPASLAAKKDPVEALRTE